MKTPFALFALTLTVGCATVPRPDLAPTTAKDAAALNKAVEQFYAAATVNELRAALSQAQAAGEHTPDYHELAAQLSMLEGDEPGAMEHLMSAVLDPEDPAPLLHIAMLQWLDVPLESRERLAKTYETLATKHPSDSVRVAAAARLAKIRSSEGNKREAERWVKVMNPLDFAWVGTWDNEAAKGFEQEYPVERRPNLDETYPGRHTDLAWRRDVPKDVSGEYDLEATQTPGRWALAYGQTDWETTEPGEYELRLTTTDPLKVWLDGRLVFSAAELERSVTDHLVIPLKLQKGHHRVLVKSAHQDGRWTFWARLAKNDAREGSPGAQIAAKRLNGPGEKATARAWAHFQEWAHMGVGGSRAVTVADGYLAAFPKSLMARTALVEALWFNQERGRVADALTALDKDAGDQLPFIRLRQARFLHQQGLKLKARELLLPMVGVNKVGAAQPQQKTAPAAREAWELLADYYRDERWDEDELLAREHAANDFPATAPNLAALARTQNAMGYREEANATWDRLLDFIPAHYEALRFKAEQLRTEGKFNASAKAYAKRVEAFPTDYFFRLDLAEAYRRANQPDAAVEQFQAAAKLNPDAANAHNQWGSLEYLRGNKEAALVHWKKALELNPDDERLANRLDWLAPEAKGPWSNEVPDEAVLAAAIELREKLKPPPGADLAYLLDHEVTQLNSDGSTVNVVTLVAHAFNPAGRDRLVRQSLGAGRTRIIHSFAIDAQGHRQEAAGERGKSVLFRGLQPGSTIVLQYRADQPPSGYLSRHWTTSWSFQGVSDMRVKSQMVLYAPLGTKLHEQRVGPVKRSETKKDGLLRIEWTSQDMGPLVAEPAMPTVQELAANIKLSTVPDWDTMLSWEQALLEGAFRESPEIEAVAQKLNEGAADPRTKLDRIHQYVMEEIRYQQDYETFLAGVKPHPAPMVLERKYGDCKDKAVLFITLARRLGLDAHFALVRTRDAGPVNDEVPMQQFNHAIVYVPEQQGVKARFFDPTADMLDLAAVRSDDVGTRSLVFDPKTGKHTWREIPFQAPEVNAVRIDLKLKLNQKGEADGTIKVGATGRTGSSFRTAARNTEVTRQMMQRLTGAVVPGASATSEPRLLEVKSLEKPAEMEVDLGSRSFGRPEGDTMRVRLPTDWTPRSTFVLPGRRHPLLLGAPAVDVLRTEIALPEGYTVARLPVPGGFDLPCLSFNREAKAGADGKSVTIEQTLTTKCERVSASEYQKYREQADQVTRVLDDELVLAPEKKDGKPPKVKAGKTVSQR